MSQLQVGDFPTYQVDPVRGFLPSQDPLRRLPPDFETWEGLATQLSDLLLAGRLRTVIDNLRPLDVKLLKDERQLRRAMLLLSVLGNSYVWEGDPPASMIPAGLAVPWYTIAEKLGRPPIIAHASMVLDNWRRLDDNGALDLENLASLQLILGGLDESWFYLVTVAIEAAGAPALPAMVKAQQASDSGRISQVVEELHTLQAILGKITAILARMPEKCDPYVFFHRIRRYVTGWDAPGVIYEGVSDKPLMLAGGSAAQSALLQSLDAGLGVRHEAAESSDFLRQMRDYIPPSHRRFIEALETGSSIRQYVLNHRQEYPQIGECYNDCIQALDRFRQLHMEIAVRYISHQAPDTRQAKGTGGTEFVSFLSTSRKETRQRLLDDKNN